MFTDSAVNNKCKNNENIKDIKKKGTARLREIERLKNDKLNTEILIDIQNED